MKRVQQQGELEEEDEGEENEEEEEDELDFSFANTSAPLSVNGEGKEGKFGLEMLVNNQV